MLTRSPTVESEEQLALALALSASEAEYRRVRGAEPNRELSDQALQRRIQEQRDLELALKLQAESNRAGSGGRQGQQAGTSRVKGQSSSGNIILNGVNKFANANKCPTCGKPALFDCIKAFDRRWHPECFSCGGCGRRVQGSYIPRDGEPYHPVCHEALFQEKCTVCHEGLPRTGNRITWSQHPFWNEKYCPKHDRDGTWKCTACERLKSKNAEWIKLQDDRHLCTSCTESIVVDTEDCQSLYTEILAMYADLGFPLPTRPPLMLVDQQALNECTSREGAHGGAPVSQIRGMTLTEEYRSIRRVTRHRGSGWNVFPELVPVENRHCSVTAILVLYGFPRLLTGSILAHEVMHAWLKLLHITDLSLDVEEGLCQLMALVWLENQEVKESYEERLKSYIANQIKTHPSPIYGDGFRAAYKAYQHYGLEAVINHIRATKQFPVV